MKTIIFNPMSGITQPFMYYLQHVLSGRVVSACKWFVKLTNYAPICEAILKIHLI